jgi:hypothetical protein
MLAQYELMNCRPRAAQARINSIADPIRRKLFQAVLLSLVSVERKIISFSSSEKAEHARDGIRTLPFDPEEIWQDEWKEIHITSSCTAMPLIPDLKVRAEAREEARELFSQLPKNLLRSDINILALAMDVGLIIDDPENAIDELRAFHENPYYRRLLRQIQSRAEERWRGHLKATSLSKNEMTLSELKLRNAVEEVHPIEMPMLFDIGGVQ